jgi:hypothetical protein
MSRIATEPPGQAPDRELEVARATVGSFHECFNSSRYFEAHDVLEMLWLPRRREPEGNLWKGLIQLAGAFVHVQKGRRGPALALLDLASSNLQPFAPRHPLVGVAAALALAEDWRRRLADPAVRLPDVLEDRMPQLAGPDA